MQYYRWLCFKLQALLIPTININTGLRNVNECENLKRLLNMLVKTTFWQVNWY